MYFIHAQFNEYDSYVKNLDVQFIFYHHGRFIARFCNKLILDRSNLRKFHNSINGAILDPIALCIDVAGLMDSYYRPTGG